MLRKGFGSLEKVIALDEVRKKSERDFSLYQSLDSLKRVWRLRDFHFYCEIKG